DEAVADGEEDHHEKGGDELPPLDVLGHIIAAELELPGGVGLGKAVEQGGGEDADGEEGIYEPGHADGADHVEIGLDLGVVQDHVGEDHDLDGVRARVEEPGTGDGGAEPEGGGDGASVEVGQEKHAGGEADAAVKEEAEDEPEESAHQSGGAESEASGHAVVHGMTPSPGDGGGADGDLDHGREDGGGEGDELGVVEAMEPRHGHGVEHGEEAGELDEGVDHDEEGQVGQGGVGQDVEGDKDHDADLD